MLVGLPAALSGATAVHLLREGLQRHGFTISENNVYVRGLTIEFDLLLLKGNASQIKEVDFPNIARIYDPSDVLAALEIKGKGNFEAELERLRRNKRLINEAYDKIQYIYVALGQRRGYKGAATTENLGFPAFNLVWYKGDGNHPEDSGEWTLLLERLQRLAGVVE